MPIQTRVQALGGALSAADADVLAVPVPAGAAAPDAEIAAFLPVPLGELLELHRAKGEAGEVNATPVKTGDRVRELLLYGVGAATPADLRRAGAAVARRAKGRGSLAVGVPSGDLAAFVEGALLASYEFWIGRAPSRRAVETVFVLTEAGPEAAADAVALGTVRARATAAARDLANTPSGEKGPSWLADRAVETGERAGLTVRVRDEKELAEGGFGGLVAVGGGSPRPPRLVELAYRPDGADGAPHVVLVGKGITFDSGGLSLKPGPAMTTMKTDMAGSAVVLGVLGALRDLGVRVRVTGLLAVAENMPSGSAMRPGDVITHFGGTTSEVLNTDAEGRLVLADALAYADAELDPDVLIDVATLTGAAKVALGLRHGALFASDDALAAALTAAGEAAGEPLWRLPLTEEYRPAIESDVADIVNTGRPGYGAGAITAALFLREFTGDRAWAHLDVAGPARASGDDGENTKGATGYATRLLLSYLGGLG
ncbi:leucyl aminopeptidase [Actinomadura atramentaria]|uniref:leucyl aminopeptidase n=1 Tax=Actinomadura atramentaria TaxID=1990 RepID=UPI00037C84BB|nr:leucyl aminopeptidase [Actinomadura atramentaria]